MAELSKIRKNGVDYDIKDATAREAIEKLKQNGTGDGSGGNVDCILPVDFSGVTVHSVNHRGYSSAAPENTIPAYIMSKEKGFVCVEADVAFTSDGVAVLLHDNTIDRTSHGSGRISALTFAEVSKYDFGSWKSATYTGTRIPTFAEFIAFCKNVGLHPYIELKNAATYTAAQIRSLVEMVNNCGMRGNVSWISFTATYLGYVRDADPTARLGYLCPVSTPLLSLRLRLCKQAAMRYLWTRPTMMPMQSHCVRRQDYPLKFGQSTINPSSRTWTPILRVLPVTV